LIRHYGFEIKGDTAGLPLFCVVGGTWHALTKPFAWARYAFEWSGKAYLSYILYNHLLLHKKNLLVLYIKCFVRFLVFGLSFVWFNNTVYPSEFYGSVRLQASQAIYVSIGRNHGLGA
jgi:photosystem II CP43 chlorophyll apoprotein